MTPDHETFASWDAAYVLGALTPADRRAFEAHLVECEQCRSAVADLAAMPGLLSRARPLVDAVESPAPQDPPPSDLVRRVVRRRRRSIRTRLVLAGAGALVVAAAAVFAVPALIGAPPADEAVALAPVGTTPLTATVELHAVAWGTRLEMECSYPAADGWIEPGAPRSYALVVTDEHGEASQVSTWNAVPGRVIRLAAATSLDPDDIASVEVRSAAGDVLLTGSPG